MLEGARETDSFNLELFRAPSGYRWAVANRLRPPRHRAGEPFLKGPIPFAWVASACRLDRAGLRVVLLARFLNDRFRRGRDDRWTIDMMAKGLGSSDETIRRGLAAAERAGLIAVARSPVRRIVAADVTVLDPGGETAGRRPLRGPVPWTWLHPALKLPTPAVRVAVACWLQAGWEQSAAVGLPLSGWADLGLTRFSAGPGLARLQEAGLVAVERRARRPPLVTLLDVRDGGNAKGETP
jgi:hypothetical protein